MIAVACQRWRSGAASYRPAGETIATRLYEVAEIAKDGPARAFVEAHHYSRSYPAARRRYGLYRAGSLVGVAVFSVPCRSEVLRPLPESAEAAELGRFVLLDDVPANGETWALARCFELLRRDGFEGVVSFSDPWPRATLDGRRVFGGHVGTIYQAHNAVYLGQARTDTARLLPDGRSLHNRAVAKIRGLDKGWRAAAQALVDAGAPPIEGDPRTWVELVLPRLVRTFRRPGNHKYVWGLTRAVRRGLPTSKRYPKMGGLS